MSSIRERTVLCFADLPKKLTSRRNLLAHFSKFGEVKHVSLNKEHRTAMVQFATHFEAQSAKTQGKIYDGNSLNIFWSESSNLDPRAREKPESSQENEPLWQEDDDKESFGVEALSPKEKPRMRMTAGGLIKQHLKLSNLKKNVSMASRLGDGAKKGTVLLKTKPTKVSPKVLASVKKKISLAQGTKRKIIGAEEPSSKTSVFSSDIDIEENIPKSTILMSERVDLKMKLAILDERDKMIRLETVKESNIETAVAIKGTCPDMCPERERILRQYGHSVALYEMISGTTEMDENKAVKEYTRSSADQEVPLPHDLRPEPVLSMTMNYLVTKIITRIDNPTENKAVWYSFCWNRLRSIRKDIILQQLCDMETVKIVEQCARFHIACYDHMWGADVSGFDDKINTQNLIDCLQTLQHMYEDLAKHNIICPNEAEFYSYLILLKLTSGDVIWEYQQYSMRVQHSPQVQLAIEAYMAFKTNMYSKYFRLVEKASYLTACLMQRYFDRVRTQALKVMGRAYCLPNKAVGLSSSFIVAALKFDSQSSALDFCDQKEIEVKVDCESTEPNVDTSSFLIRQKRFPIANAVVGEGNPLPLYIPHHVTSSFDDTGRLKRSLSFTSDEEDSKTETEKDFNEESFYSAEDNSEVNIPVASQTPFKFSLSPVSSSGLQDNIFTKSIFSNQTKMNEKSNETEKFQFSQENNQPIDNSYAKISFEETDANNYEYVGNIDQGMEVEESKREVISDPVPSSSMFSFQFKSPLTTHEHTTSKAAEGLFTFGFNKQDASMFKSNLTSNENPPSLSFTNFSRPTKDSFDGNQPKEQQPDNSFNFKSTIEVEKTNPPADNRLGAIISDNFQMEKCVDEPKIEEPSAEEIEKAHKALLLEKLQLEKAEKEKQELERLKKLEIEKQKRKLEEQRALQALKKDVRERMKAINARKIARMWREKVEFLKVKRTKADFPMLVPLSVQEHLSCWGSVNLVPLLTITERAKFRRNMPGITSKLLKYGISDSGKYVGSVLAETLAYSASKIVKGGNVKPIFWKLGVSVPWENSSLELSVFNKSMKKWFHRALYRKASSHLGSAEHVLTSLGVPVNISVHFADDINSSRNLKGVDALVFIILNDAESKETCLQRLRRIVSQCQNGRTSIAVMNVGGCRNERVLKEEFETLSEQDLLAHWCVKHWFNHDSIISGLNFLAQNVKIATNICASTLELLLRQTSEEFFDALSASHYSNLGLMEATKNPNNIIQLYNLCLTKLEDLLVSSKLEKSYNVSEEFKKHIPQNECGGPELLCGVKYDNSYKSLLTKKIFEAKLSELEDWPPTSPFSLVETLKFYCREEAHDMDVFPQIIRMLDVPDDVNIPEYVNTVFWLDIVEIWARCKLAHCFSSTTKTKRLVTIFSKDDVQSLLKSQWWLKTSMVMDLSVVTN